MAGTQIEEKSETGKLFFLIFLVPLILFFGTSAYLSLENIKRQKEGVVTEGLVTATGSSRGYKNNIYYTSTVEFKDANSNVFTFTEKAHFKMGDKVSVLYNKTSPDIAKITSWARLWTVPVLLFSAGCLLLISYAVIRKRMMRKLNKVV